MVKGGRTFSTASVHFSAHLSVLPLQLRVRCSTACLRAPVKSRFPPRAEDSQQGRRSTADKTRTRAGTVGIPLRRAGPGVRIYF